MHVMAFLALSLFSLFALSAPASAEPSCSVWMWWNYWQQCVFDDGSRRCYRATDDSGSGSTEISC